MKTSSAPLQTIDNKILVTIKPQQNIKSIFFANKPSTSFYVPKDSSIHYLMNYLSSKLNMNQKQSFFLFAYGSILNNHEKIGTIFEKFKNKVSQDYGIEIQITQMSTFGK